MPDLNHKRLTIIIAAGGTGGHMIPAEAVACELSSRGHRVVLITDPRGDSYPAIMDGFDRHVLSTSGISGGVLGKIKGGLSLGRETIKCRGILAAEGADMVIGFGGYPSMPVVAAARLKSIPYVLHEQNTVLGRVNRLMAPKAVALALSYHNTSRIPENVEYFLTGNPVRQMVLEAAKAAPPKRKAGDKLTILVMGGSQGAHILSKIAPTALAAIKDCDACLHVMHQARAEDKQAVEDIYKQAGIEAEVESYFLDIPARLSRADLVISRAGASSLSEIAVLGVPSLLVPLKIAMDDHQTSNAADLADRGAAIVLREDDFSAEKVTEIVSGLFADINKLDSMATAAKKAGVPKSAARVADMIEKVSKRL